ncbi:MAG: hypothetical protein DCC65_00770 [Planctomycetota bacterium]|nr:MAG: hypothetical protein DCC65_00770 [Planctomycetota bacterium]
MSILLRILEPEMKAPLAAAGLIRYADFVGCAGGEVVHQSGTTCTRRLTVRTASGDDVLYLKAYRYDGKAVPFRLTSSKPLREARNYRLLREQCGIDVPDVVALGSRRRGPLMTDGFVVTRAVPDCQPLDAFAAGRPNLRLDGLRDKLCRDVMERTAEAVARMHTARVYHIDLQWRNMLVSLTNPEEPRVYLLDCARGGRRRHPWRCEHGRLRDLSSLYKEARVRLSPRQQIWWLRRYLDVRKLTEVHRLMMGSILLDRAIKDHEESA